MTTETDKGNWRLNRTFTAEITFNGLVVMRVPGDPRSARVELLFVRTHAAGPDHGPDHQHFPRLTYYADDQLGLLPKTNRWPLNYDYFASPEGRQTVSVDLTDKRVEILPFYSPKAQTELKLHRSSTAAAGVRFPDQSLRGDDQSLDWVLSADQIGLEPVDRNAAVTVIEPPHGHWRTHGVYRNREVRTLEPIHWLVGQQEQAMGRDLVLELKGLSFGLTLRISNRSPDDDPDPHDIVLTPDGEGQPAGAAEPEAGGDRSDAAARDDGSDPDQLKLSLTNLPGSHSHADVSHVTMYGQLSGQHAEVMSPTQIDDVVCAQAACTPVKETGGGR